MKTLNPETIEVFYQKDRIFLIFCVTVIVQSCHQFTISIYFLDSKDQDTSVVR